MSRKIWSNGQLIDFEDLFSRDSNYKSKVWKYNKQGDVEEATTIADDDIVFSGSKSNLRRVADLERNVSILSTKLLTAQSSANYDSDDDDYESVFDQDVRFKGEVRIDHAPTIASDATTKGYVDTAISTAVGAISIPSLTGYASETYVDTAISNLVDTAPTTLDTLNELAAALGDDPNFATTITNSLGNKADSSSLATVATSGDYNDLTNLPTIPTNNNQLTNGAGYITGYTVTQADVTAHQAALSITESQISDLTHYTNSDAVSAITANDLDMGSNKILYANMYPTEGDLPDASTYHGMFAHVHGTGRGYFAHAGSWTALANQSELFSGSYNDLTNKPTIPADVSDLTDTTNLLDHFSGAYTDLTGAPTIPTDISDLTDNNSLLSSGGGGASVEYGSTAPSSPSQGDLWFDTSVGTLYVYDGSAWITTASAVGGGSGGGASLEVGDTAPESPDAGALWFKTDTLNLYVYYSSNWVEIGDGGSGGTSGGGGASVTVDTSAPTDPSEGDLWYNSNYGDLLIYLGNAWVLAAASSSGGSSSGASELDDLSDVDTSTTAPTVGQTLVWDGTNWVPGAAVAGWSTTSSSVELSANQKMLVDTTSSAVTLTLPASPSMGDEVRIVDAGGNAATNNITIDNNSNNILGFDDTLVIDTDDASIALVYFNATRGWIITEK